MRLTLNRSPHERRSLHRAIPLLLNPLAIPRHPCTNSRPTRSQGISNPCMKASLRYTNNPLTKPLPHKGKRPVTPQPRCIRVHPHWQCAQNVQTLRRGPVQWLRAPR